MFSVHSMTVPMYQTMISRSMLLCGFILLLQSAASSHAAALSDAVNPPEKMLLQRQRPTPAPSTVPFRLGQNVTLKCRVPRGTNIAAVLWTRPDLGVYVCYYRDDRCDPENQHPSYEHRVDLADQDLKDGNVSVILMNVSDGDVGTYQCHIKERRGGDVITSGPICTISTSLEAPDATAGNTTAGNITAGNTTAGNTTAGNTTAGNITAGNTTAGNTTAGNTTAGNTTADGGLDHVGLTVVLVVAAVVVVGFICVRVYFFYNRQKKQQLEQKLSVLYKSVPVELIRFLTPGQESASKSSGDQDPAGPSSKQQV